MKLTGTHTYALLEVLPSTHEDIRSRLEQADYHHAIDQETGLIDMTGLAIEPSRLPMRTVRQHDVGSAMKSYRHHKGGTYTLLMVARSSEQRDELLAIYVSHQTQQVWARPWGMFKEVIAWPDGVRRPRFIEMTPDDPASQ